MVVPYVLDPAYTLTDWLGRIPGMFSTALAVSRSIFNPMYFGTFFTVLFVYAWFRMEAMAEAKRKETNFRILSKKAVEGGESLLEYSDRINGKIFEHNTATDVVNSMFSKGKTPLRMAPMCQPALAPPGPNILWESNCVRIKSVPLLHRDSRSKLFDAVRQISPLTIKDALQVLSVGGIAYWRDPHKKIFSKEKTVYTEFNFYDSDNFLAIYLDSSCMKRLSSIRASSLLDCREPDFDFRELEMNGEKIRFHDPMFFSAICLFLCHAQLLPRSKSELSSSTS
jgi:hypothetical protein